MPNDPGLAGVKHVKNKQGGYTLRNIKTGKRVTKASAKKGYQKVYAKQYAMDLGQSAYAAQLPSKRQAQIRRNASRRRNMKVSRRRAA